MAYCVFGDVRMRCVTDISDPDITTMIEESDAYLDLKMDMSSLTVPMRRRLSATLTSIMCMLRNPTSLALGEYREDRRYSLEKLNEEFDGMIKIASGGTETAGGIAGLYSYVPVRST